MLDRMMASRIAIFLSNVILFYVLLLVNRNYASVDFGIYGYVLSDFSYLDLVVLTLLMTMGSVSVPRLIRSASSLILVVTYWFILVPFQVLGLTGAPAESGDRYDLLFIVHIGFFICCILNRRDYFQHRNRVAHRLLLPALVILWAITAALLIVRFGSIMRISAANLIYEQREIGRATNFLDGYLQTYSQYVFSTSLVAFGCYKRNLFLVFAGVIGAILNFSITAEKSSIGYPLFIIALYYMLKSRNRFFSSSSFAALSLSLMCSVGLSTRSFSSVGEFLSWYVGVRTLLTPGQQIVLYYDYFTERGYTYFSQIRGLNLLIPVPHEYADESRWPGLGLIIGDLHLGLPGLNSNANFIATDGIASMGYLGVLIVFILVGLLLKIFDSVSKGIDPVLFLPILLPLALTLTNGSIFTILSSFGGIFWALIFLTMFGKKGTD